MQGESDDNQLIVIGLGANLPSRFGAPAQTLEAALARMNALGLRVLRRSSLWHSAPQPVSDQPWFVNAVAAVETEDSPATLLATLHAIEAEFGRIRGETNAARALDLDLLAYRRLVSAEIPPLLPHPRLHQRAFVLLPLAEIAGRWCDPRSGARIDALIAALPTGHTARRLS